MGNLTVKESGEMVNIISPNVNNITSFKVHFSPKQEGTGDPNPENIREIVGWNGVEGHKCGKNMTNVIGYSAKTVNEPYASRYLSNAYGTAISTIEPTNELTVTQTIWNDSKDKWHYTNGYFVVVNDNLIFNQYYKISFKVTNIIDNHLNSTISDIRVLPPKGNGFIVHVNGDYVYSIIQYLPNSTSPNRNGIEIHNCGMSFTMSDFMVTAVDNEDYTYEPFQYSKNLFDYTHANIVDKRIKNDSGVSVADGGNSYCQTYIPVIPNTTYTLSGLSNEKRYAKRVYYYDESKQWISRTSSTVNQTFTITTPSNCKYIQIQSERQEFQDWSTVQVELGDTVTEFEPYKYGTVPINWSANIKKWTYTDIIVPDNYSTNNFNGYGNNLWDNIIEDIPSEWFGKSLTYSVYIDRAESPYNSYDDVRVWFYGDSTTMKEASSTYRITEASSSGRSWVTFTIPDGTTKLALGLYLSKGSRAYNPQLEFGELPTDYQSYAGDIYGGYVDLITGEIWKSYDIASGLWKNWDTSGELDNYIRKRLVTPYRPVGGNASSTSLCNITGTYLWSNTTESTHFYVGNSGNTVYAILPKTLDENQEVQISYKLTEPVYITTLSPTQLSTLKGQNNFWSNADYVEIEYELTETFDIQKAKRKIILNQPHVESAFGTIAKPETDMIGKIKECKIHFMPVQQGDSDPTPDNIVPITGWTGINVYSTGKNLFNLNVPVGLPSSTVGANTTNRIFTPYTVIKGTSGTNYYNPSSVNSYSISDDILTVNSRSGYGVGFAIKAKPNYTYTISASCDNNYGRVAVSTYSKDGVFKKIAEAVSLIAHPKYTFTTNSNTDMLLLTFYAANGGYNVDVHYSNIQLEIGNTVTNYEPFKGNITSVNWENEVGTIYGGYVDLISGKLVQEFKQCKINELSWTYIASGACFVTSKNTPNDILKNRSLLISYIRSDYYTPIDGYGDIATYNNFQDYSISLYAPSDQYRIAIKDSRFTDVSSFLSAMGDTYIWYRLAEPTVTYQLTPQQLTTLRGINNIWSSANGEVEIKYWKH